MVAVNPVHRWHLETQVQTLQASPRAGDMTPQQVLETYREEIRTAAEKNKLPPELIAAVIWQSSRGHRFAPNGGLMQLGGNEFWACGGGDIHQPGDNIAAGSTHLMNLLREFGRVELALRAYNSGPHGVDVNNPDATPAGTGDPAFVYKVMLAARTLGLR